MEAKRITGRERNSRRAPAAYGQIPGFEDIEVTALGLRFAKKRALTEDELSILLERMSTDEKASVWAQGDAAVMAADTVLKDVADELHMNYGTLRNRRMVAHAFDLSRRRDKLSFEHHAAVVRLEEKDQEELLNWAEQTKASVRALRDKVDQKLGRQHEGDDPDPKQLGDWLEKKILPNLDKLSRKRRQRLYDDLGPVENARQKIGESLDAD